MKKYTNIKKIWNIVKKDKKYMIWLSIYGLLYTMITTIIPAILGMMVGTISDGNFRKTIVLCFIVILIYIISSLLSIFYTKLYCLTKNKLIFSLRQKLSEKILDLESSEFDRHTSGLFLTRIKDDPDNIVSAYNEIRLNLTRGFANAAVIIYIFALNWIIGSVYLVSFLLIFYLRARGIDRYMKKKRIYLTELENSTTIFSEMIKGIKDIKILNLKNAFRQKTTETFIKLNNADTAFQMAMERYYYFSDLLQNLTSIFVVMLGIFLINHHMLTVTSLLVIFMYKDRVYDLLTMFTFLKESIQEANLSVDRMFEIMQNKKFKIENYGEVELINPQGNIEFKNVKFGYRDKTVFQDLNLKIGANRTVAIVGKSGAGKTTILNLLTKSYAVDDGQILIDGIDINTLTEKSIKENISMISQNPYIFNMTISENLKLVKPDATEEEIIKVCELSQINDYILSLKDGYHTLIGEGGVNLSGGQKQRLAIARALLRQSKIILFDEATSALDNSTQNEILKSIQNISKDHTVIIVAHRLSTIRKCNNIFVVDKGKIIASGTHKQLVDNCPIYAKLYKNEFVES